MKNEATPLKKYREGLFTSNDLLYNASYAVDMKSLIFFSSAMQEKKTLEFPPNLLEKVLWNDTFHE